MELGTIIQVFLGAGAFCILMKLQNAKDLKVRKKFLKILFVLLILNVINFANNIKILLN